MRLLYSVLRGPCTLVSEAFRDGYGTRNGGVQHWWYFYPYHAAINPFEIWMAVGRPGVRFSNHGNAGIRKYFYKEPSTYGEVKRSCESEVFPRLTVYMGDVWHFGFVITFSTQ